MQIYFCFFPKRLAVFTDKKTDQIINISLDMDLFKWNWFYRPTIVLVAIDSARTQTASMLLSTQFVGKLHLKVVSKYLT